MWDVHTHTHTSAEEEHFRCSITTSTTTMKNDDGTYTRTYKHHTSLGASNFSAGQGFVSNNRSIIQRTGHFFISQSEHPMLISCGMVRNKNQQFPTDPPPSRFPPPFHRGREQCSRKALYGHSIHPACVVGSKSYVTINNNDFTIKKTIRMRILS